MANSMRPESDIVLLDIVERWSLHRPHLCRCLAYFDVLRPLLKAVSRRSSTRSSGWLRSIRNPPMRQLPFLPDRLASPRTLCLPRFLLVLDARHSRSLFVFLPIDRLLIFL